MTSNTTAKFTTVLADVIEQEELEITSDVEHEEQALIGFADNGFRGLSSITQSQSFLVSRRYDPIKFNCAVKAICNEYGLLEHDVEGPLLQLHVFGVNTQKLSTEAIINLWDDHCYSDAANDCDFDGGFDAA